MNLSVMPFGQLPDGRTVHQITLNNQHGMQAVLLTYGATLQSLLVPGKDGRLADVVLGYDTLDGYLYGNARLGATIGRCANRIAGGRFRLLGKEYKLPEPASGEELPYGRHGFDRQLWKVEDSDNSTEPWVTLRYHSPHLEGGFPGNLQVDATFTLTDDNALKIAYSAVSDTPTLINLTNHTYFQIAGYDQGDVLEQELFLASDSYIPMNAQCLPAGKPTPVIGTPMDFTVSKPIGQDLNAPFDQLELMHGYAHNYVLRHTKPMRKVAQLHDPKTGRSMQVFSDQLGMELYTASLLDGSEIGKSGLPLQQYGGVCLELQGFPYAIAPGVPSVVYKEGEEYQWTAIYRFVG